MNEFIDKLYELGALGYKVVISNSLSRAELYVDVYKIRDVVLSDEGCVALVPVDEKLGIQRVVDKADMLDFCNGIDSMVKDLDDQINKSKGE